MHHSLYKLAPAVLILGSLGLGGCATKGYVNRQIASVNQRIDGLQTQLNTTTSTAQAAQAAAQAAGGQAQQNAQSIQTLSGRVDSLEQQMAQRKKARN
jgi:outer membrane murein-binding lipoprotein Lpp